MAVLLSRFNRITFDPQVMAGRACIRGMRIAVSLVIGLLGQGMSVSQIVDAYPELEPGDIQQSLKYAAWLAEDRIEPLEVLIP